MRPAFSSAVEPAYAADTRVVLRRMNRAEYNNTVRDLLGVNFQPAEKFPEDSPAGGFDNIGMALTISPLHMEHRR